MRIGYHVNSDRGNQLAVEYCRSAKPAVMKWLAPERAVIEACRAASPNTRHIGRVVTNEQDLGDAYDRFRRRLLDFAREHAEIDWIETYNEPAWHGRDLAAYAKAEVKTAEALNAFGRRVLLGGFSTGFLDLGDAGSRDWDAWLPAMRYCHMVGPDRAAMHSHEYSGPYMQYMAKTPDGLNQWDHEGRSFTGPSSAASIDAGCFEEGSLTGWLTLRYRNLMAKARREGLTGLRLYLTETGIDDVNPRPGGPNKKGWRDYHGTEWSKLPGIGDYAQQMAWYARQLTRDHPHFIGGAVDFGFGTIDPAWNSFDLAQHPDMRGRFIATQLSVPNGPTPLPMPQPQPIPEDQHMKSLKQLLSDRLGAKFEDLRTSLRSNPTGRRGPFGTRTDSTVKYVAVHHSATPRTTTWDAVAAYHVDNKGWAGIGYHFGIDDGVVSYLGTVNTTRANVEDHNHEVVGVCFMGDYSGADRLTPADVKAFRILDECLTDYFGRVLTILGHGQFSSASTACPGPGVLEPLSGARNPLPVPTEPIPAPTPGPNLTHGLLIRAGLASQVVRLNSGAAFQSWMLRHGLWPVGNEFELTTAGTRYVGQLAADPKTGVRRVIVARAPDWHAIFEITE